MKKQYCRYLINFESKWIQGCSILMGLGFFSCLLYYFAIASLRDVGAVELIFALLMGIVLCGGFVVCITCLRLNAPGLYGIIGAVECLCILFLAFTTGDVVRILLSVVWYIPAAFVLLRTVGGYLPGRLLAAVMFFVPVVVRVLFFDLGSIDILAWVRELFVLCTLSGTACFAMSLYSVKRMRE